MSITYDPKKLLRKMAPKKKIEKLITQRLTLNRAVLSSLTDSGILSKKTLQDIALRVLKQYRTKRKEEIADGLSKAAATDVAVNDKRLMIQRVQNAAIFEINSEIKRQYRGEFYEWLPSDAAEPDPIHQLNYGQTFQLGKGEAPGDRYGCRCGMEILVDESKLEL